MRLGPRGVIALLCVLIGVQLAALGTQFVRGFRPFSRAPGRVLFSWDMFAVPIERCGMSFAPPLAVGGGRIESLRATFPTLEFDLVWDTVDTYLEAAKATCALSSGGQVHLTCYVPPGETKEYVVLCR